MANIYGRQVIVTLTNKSGGAVVAGDVVVPDGANDSAFTTTTSASVITPVWIVQESIANNATGRVLIGGYAALVNVNASVTRGNYGATFTVAKQATDGGASRTAGTFCRFLTGGTTPIAYVYPTDLLGSSLTNPMTTKGDIILGDTGGTPSRLGAGAAGAVLTAAGAGAFPTWATKPVSASYSRATSGDYTTSSTTFVAVDGTNMSFSLTTGAHRCLVTFTGTVVVNTNGNIAALDVAVDGTRLGASRGLVVCQNNVNANGSFSVITDVLTAAAHTFELQWLVAGSTPSATIPGGSASNPTCRFSVVELLA